MKLRNKIGFSGVVGIYAFSFYVPGVWPVWHPWCACFRTRYSLSTYFPSWCSLSAGFPFRYHLITCFHTLRWTTWGDCWPAWYSLGWLLACLIPLGWVTVGLLCKPAGGWLLACLILGDCCPAWYSWGDSADLLDTPGVTAILLYILGWLLACLIPVPLGWLVVSQPSSGQAQSHQPFSELTGFQEQAP